MVVVQSGQHLIRGETPVAACLGRSHSEPPMQLFGMNEFRFRVTRRRGISLALW